jgi:hypothetical protein
MVEGTTETASLRLFVKRAKQRSGRAYLAVRGGPLWQEGYFDRVLRPGDDAKALARYIVANPVRAHLVAHPLEYPYSGSDVWPLRDLCEAVMW